MKYDCIYKNLFRDIRRYFSNVFNETTNYSREKYTNEPLFYIKVLTNYVRASFDLKLLEGLGVSEVEFISFFGSLIYPKEMLKIYSSDAAVCK
jgi:hypothetical protein